MTMHERAVDAAMAVECKKDCGYCGKLFSKHSKDSMSQWTARRFCCPRCANQDAADRRKVQRPLSVRFFEKIEKNDGCWGWVGCKTKDGYGRIGTDWGTDNAHRVSWLLHKGSIPDDLHVLHECDNPPCTNPNHLFLGTFQDNMQDKVNKGRGQGPKGANNPNVKLTGGKAAEIYSRYLSGEQMKMLAEEFGVTPPCVHDICWGRTWVDFTGAKRIR